MCICNILFLSGSSAGIRAGAVWTRECRTAGIRKLRPATDCRSLPGHPGASGQRSGGVLLTGPEHGAHSSCFSFPFFCVSLDFTGCQPTNSLTLTHMHKSKDRHIRERLTAHKSSARLDWLWGVLSFCCPLPPHSSPPHLQNPIYTHINMGKKKPKEGNGLVL